MPEFLEKKIAGIPVYVWTILILVAIGLGLYLRNRARSQGALADDSGVDVSGESFPIAGTIGGGPGGGGIIGGGPGGTLPPEPAPAPAPAEYLPPFPAFAPFPEYLPVISPAETTQAPSAVAVAAPPQAPPSTIVSPPAPKAGPVPGASFTWLFSAATFRGEKLPAKSVWYAADKPLFLKHLGARGLTYASWRDNHRPAACRVFGDC